MNTKAIEKQLLSLETQYWRAIKDQDLQAMLRLTDDPCIVAGAQGARTYGIDDMKRMIQQNRTYTLDDFEISDQVEVRMLRDDVAILAYKVHEELTVDGKPVAFDATEASTWVRRDDRWLCALHTESIAGDAFGRDRKPAPRS